MYTVKRLADLASVTVRTLHHYHKIGLLEPSQIASNGYRHYSDADLMRLQQILFYRELGLELLEIKTILDDPEFDIIAALDSHRKMLERKIERLYTLSETVDETILYLKGKENMSKKQLFDGFDEDQQKDYERQARLEYGPTHVNESVRRWGSYSDDQKQAILAEMQTIYQDLAQAIEAGKSPDSEEVQTILERWEANIHHFYTPDLEIIRGLGQLYNSSPEFMATFQQIHKDLPQYLEDSITYYVDEREHAEIVRLLAEDEADQDYR